MAELSPQIQDTPLILSLETATRAGSIAVTRGETILASSSAGAAEESHSTNLLQHIQTLLEQVGVRLNEIELFAVALGPGSFTGLRIGLATIKGFGATLKRPCLGVGTLSAVAHAAGVSDATYALLPAGRGEVFAQLFKVSAGGEVTPLSEALHIAPQVLLERMNDGMRSSLLWAGAGANVFAETIRERAHRLGLEFMEKVSSVETEGVWTLAPTDDTLAEHVALLALRQARQIESVADYAPEKLCAVYVRPSDAEMNQ